MIASAQHLSAQRAKIEEIGRNFGVSNIRVFGSFARGAAQDGSDLDLLVRIESGRSLLDSIGFEQAISELLGMKVDVVEEGGIHPQLESTILLEAKPL